MARTMTTMLLLGAVCGAIGVWLARRWGLGLDVVASVAIGVGVLLGLLLAPPPAPARRR